MSMQEWWVVGITALTLVLILSNRFAPDLVALLVLLALAFSGLVTPEQSVSGFSSSIALTLIGLFMLTDALETTGIVRRIANRLNRMAGGSATRLMLLFMIAAMLLSLVMNNVAVGAVLLPAAVRVGQIARVPLSKLLMPLSFGVMLGGMATYFTTGNIVISGLLQDSGYVGLNMADFLLTGGFVALWGFLYMALIGRRLLPVRAGFGDDDPVAGPMLQALTTAGIPMPPHMPELWPQFR